MAANRWTRRGARIPAVRIPAILSRRALRSGAGSLPLGRARRGSTPRQRGGSATRRRR